MAWALNRRKKAAISSLAAKDTCSSSKPVWPTWATIPACRRMWPASGSVTRQFSPFSVSKRKNNNNSKRWNRNECQIESRLGCVQWNIHNAQCVYRLEIDLQCRTICAKLGSRPSITQPNSSHGNLFFLSFFLFASCVMQKGRMTFYLFLSLFILFFPSLLSSFA